MKTSWLVVVGVLTWGALVFFLRPVGLARQASGAAAESEAQGLAAIQGTVEQAIKDGKCPGAVVLVGHQGNVVYRRAFGRRAIVPESLPMTTDTIFDLASLTKVVATAPAVMQLAEQGKIRLEDSVAEYWPEFKVNGKDAITVAELLTHYSGLRPDLDLRPDWSGYETAMRMIVAEQPIAPPATRWIYSDINYETLGELVRRLSGEPLDVYCAEHIFKPLGMKDTGFRPARELRRRIAPTQYLHRATGKLLWGEVHDPTAYNMGGVAGHAGLFSTADDLAVFVQMLLEGGTLNGERILSPLSVQKMTTPQSPSNKSAIRGLGWDIDSPHSTTRGELFPVGSFGHTGWTGTSIWIDPVSKTYVIILTNRIHPDGRGDVSELRGKIATTVAAALAGHATTPAWEGRCSLTGSAELAKSYPVRETRNGKVLTGIDVLEAERFAPLRDMRVGLITNHTGMDNEGRRTIDLLYRAPGVRLAALFSPEHGLAGNAEDRVASATEPVTGLPVYSLYGESERPTDQMLQGLNALVFDVQDAGARFYTYSTTLGYSMEAAAKKGIAFYVLDRPNPVNGVAVQGPILEEDLRSFVGYFPLPVRHGMTIGELAKMFNQEGKIGAKLRVIKMHGWDRGEWYDETGLTWVNPSPNLRTLAEETLYPGAALVEGSNVSVGRGTDTPFELLGAPWIDAKKFADYLNARKIQGVRFLPVHFSPRQDRFSAQVCHGVQIVLVDREALDSPEMGVEIAAALYKLFPNDFEFDKTLRLIGARWVVEGIKAGQDPRRIAYHWQQSLEGFLKIRAKYLLY